MNANHPPNYAQMMLDIFAGRDPGGVLWQPRIDFWYVVNKKRGTLPSHLREMSLEEVYDYCHASIRYFTSPLRRRFKNVQVTEKWEDNFSQRYFWETPVGTLTEVLHWDELKTTRYNTEYLLKTPADFKILEYILQDEEWSWDQQALETDMARVGNRGLPQFFARRSPVQSLFIESMGFENTVFMMVDHPEVITSYVEIHKRADDAMYNVICSAPIQMFNMGDNLDHHMDSPSIWRKHLLPYYRIRAGQLREAGIYSHIHVDGSMKLLLKDLQDCPTDGIEACTPLPQGDVTLEEIKFALQDRVLLDGIPAVYFLPTFPVEDLIDCAKQAVRLFHPRLVLGVSDEPPPDSDIERIRLVGELVKELV